MLIPKGFTPIAVRDDLKGICVISYNASRKEADGRFFVVVNGKALGALTKRDLIALMENIKDVLDMRGVINYINDYEPDGEQK